MRLNIQKIGLFPIIIILILYPFSTCLSQAVLLDNGVSGIGIGISGEQYEFDQTRLQDLRGFGLGLTYSVNGIFDIGLTVGKSVNRLKSEPFYSFGRAPNNGYSFLVTLGSEFYPIKQGKHNAPFSVGAGVSFGFRKKVSPISLYALLNRKFQLSSFIVFSPSIGVVSTSTMEENDSNEKNLFFDFVLAVVASENGQTYLGIKMYNTSDGKWSELSAGYLYSFHK